MESFILVEFLNDVRLNAHSLSSLLGLYGLVLAPQLGISWASNINVQVFVVDISIIIFSISIIQNTYVRQTRPSSDTGLFFYTYVDNGYDFIRAIPVALTAVLLLALGMSATLINVSHWPLAAGPAVCLALCTGHVNRHVAGLFPAQMAPLLSTTVSREAPLLFNACEALVVGSLLATQASLLD